MTDKPLVDITDTKDQQALDKLNKVSDRIAERTHRQLTKAPEKVEFKPIPVKPIEVVEQPATPISPLEREHSFIESHGALKDFFEIDRMGYEEGEKLRSVWAYLGEKFPSKGLQERIHQLRKIESKLGQPKLGQSRLGRIHSYINAQKMVEDAERWRDGVMGKIK